MSTSPYPRIGTLLSPAHTKSPSGAKVKESDDLIEYAKLRIVVPESRIAEFFMDIIQ
jgi:hypothetical protein